MSSSLGIPHLKTIQDELRFDLEKKIVANQVEIETWFRGQWLQHPALVTCSVDLRNAGFKLAAVDTNVFPAGFNNLNPEFEPLSIQALTFTLSRIYPKCTKVLIIPESHTRNPFYFESLMVLASYIHRAGFQVKIGTLRDIEKPESFTIKDKTLTQWPLRKEGNTLKAGDFRPCLVLLNHDLSEGIPTLLQNIEQPIVPSPQLGWHFRSKTKHFHLYENKAKALAKILGVDPWHIAPFFTDCGNIDFMSKEHENDLIDKTSELFDKIRAKYKEYGISEAPFVVIKSDVGTYGMNVMMIQDPNEIKTLNRKQRTRMQTGKGGVEVKRVLLQEGIYTLETIGPQHAVAEPVIYMIGEYVIGGFYRVHTGKGMQDNLNAPGMHFEPLAFEACCNTPDERLSSHDAKNQFYAYSVIARLAHLAAALETE